MLGEMGVNLNPAPIHWRKMAILDCANPVNTRGQPPPLAAEGSGTQLKKHLFSDGDNILLT